MYYIENPGQTEPAAASIKYITGYLIELSLSIGQHFMLLLFFLFFKIPQKVLKHQGTSLDSCWTSFCEV
jgi:hypothetical protein